MSLPDPTRPPPEVLLAPDGGPDSPLLTDWEQCLQGRVPHSMTRSRKERPAPWRRYAWRFVVAVVLLHVGFELWFAKTSWFMGYMGLNASISAAMLRLLGRTVIADGHCIYSAQSALAILKGCDALQPSGLFLSAILATPARLRAKVIGALTGVAVLLALNVVRILTLYFLVELQPAWFEVAHEAVWPTAFVFLALILWLAWSRRVLPQRAGGRSTNA